MRKLWQTGEYLSPCCCWCFAGWHVEGFTLSCPSQAELWGDGVGLGELAVLCAPPAAPAAGKQMSVSDSIGP